MSYMKRQTRLCAALHVLVHLAQRPDIRFTSEEMAGWWNTNPVVVRRTLATLREVQLVTSVTGPGGGWSLARDPKQINLAEIYAALGEKMIDSRIETENRTCLVLAAVETLVADTLRDFERQLNERLSETTLADLAATAPFPSPHPAGVHSHVPAS
jgi:Rrf2 family protein